MDNFPGLAGRWDEAGDDAPSPFRETLSDGPPRGRVCPKVMTLSMPRVAAGTIGTGMTTDSDQPTNTQRDISS